MSHLLTSDKLYLKTNVNLGAPYMVYLIWVGDPCSKSSLHLRGELRVGVALRFSTAPLCT